MPILGDDVPRLANDRSVISWEAIESPGASVVGADRTALARWTEAIRASDRVRPSVREKSDDEPLERYGLADDGTLANLGALQIGSRNDRARPGTAPVVQVVRHDEFGEKVWKLVWDDYTRSPTELVDAVRRGVPDFDEGYELPEGLLRTRVPAYDGSVARVVHDLGLTEREGGGFDMMRDLLLATGRSVPVVTEDIDSVRVAVRRRVLRPGVIRSRRERSAGGGVTQERYRPNERNE